MPFVFCFPLLTLSTLALVHSAFLPSSYTFPTPPSEALAAFLNGFFGRLCFLEWPYREEGTVVKVG